MNLINNEFNISSITVDLGKLPEKLLKVFNLKSLLFLFILVGGYKIYLFIKNKIKAKKLKDEISLLADIFSLDELEVFYKFKNGFEPLVVATRDESIDHMLKKEYLLLKRYIQNNQREVLLHPEIRKFLNVLKEKFEEKAFNELRRSSLTEKDIKHLRLYDNFSVEYLTSELNLKIEDELPILFKRGLPLIGYPNYPKLKVEYQKVIKKYYP